MDFFDLFQKHSGKRTKADIKREADERAKLGEKVDWLEVAKQMLEAE